MKTFTRKPHIWCGGEWTQPSVMARANVTTRRNRISPDDDEDDDDNADEQREKVDGN